MVEDEIAGYACATGEEKRHRIVDDRVVPLGPSKEQVELAMRVIGLGAAVTAETKYRAESVVYAALELAAAPKLEVE